MGRHRAVRRFGIWPMGLDFESLIEQLRQPVTAAQLRAEVQVVLDFVTEIFSVHTTIDELASDDSKERTLFYSPWADRVERHSTNAGAVEFRFERSRATAGSH